MMYNNVRLKGEDVRQKGEGERAFPVGGTRNVGGTTALFRLNVLLPFCHTPNLCQLHALFRYQNLSSKRFYCNTFFC